MPVIKRRPSVTPRVASARYKATLALAERFRRAQAAHGGHGRDWLDRLFHDPANAPANDPANDDAREPGRSRPAVREVG